MLIEEITRNISPQSTMSIDNFSPRSACNYGIMQYWTHYSNRINWGILRR